MLTAMRTPTARVAVRAGLEAVLAGAIASLAVLALSDVLFSRIETDELSVNWVLVGWLPFGEVVGADAVTAAVGRSLLLLAAAMAVALPVAIAGALAYAVARPAVRAVLWAIGTVGASVPTFFWAIAAQLLVFVLHESGTGFVLPSFGFGVGEHLILPALALAARPTAYAFRLSVSALDEVRNGDYVRTAVAKGVPGHDVLLRHVLPNAKPGIAAAAVVAARAALSSLLIVEFFFGWGGGAVSFIQAFINGDGATAAALLTVFVILSALLAMVSGALAAVRGSAR
jgi:ABC-type dipeptide/oligopeptide/nickel transport system permease component